MTQRVQNSSCIGQCECEESHSYLTRIVQVLCLGGPTHIKVGARPVCTLNISTAVLYIHCSCNGRISSAFDFADEDGERTGKTSFAAGL